jgi:hypothetical protein
VTSLPDWLRSLPPLTAEEMREGVEAARRCLERSTPDMAVETQRLIVAIGDEVARLREALTDALDELTRYHPDVADACETLRAAIGAP